MSKINEYLTKEYIERGFGAKHIKAVEIGGKKLIIPCSYVLKHKENATEQFAIDFFNHNDENIDNLASEYDKYNQKYDDNLEFDEIFYSAKEVGKETEETLPLPVPFDQKHLKKSQIKKTYIAERMEKYEDSILSYAIKNVNEVNKNSNAEPITHFSRFEENPVIPELVEAKKEKISQVRKKLEDKKADKPIIVEFEDVKENKPSKRQEKPKKSKTKDIHSLKEKAIRTGKKAILWGSATAALAGGIKLKSVHDDYKEQKDLHENHPELVKKVLQDKLFNQFMEELYEKEGGYAGKEFDGHETNYGVIEKTLEDFNKQHPEFKYPKDVKKLKQNQAKTIAKVAFFEQYKIGNIKSDKVAEMILDMTYNHSYKTIREFMKEGAIAVMKHQGKDTSQRPRQFRHVIDFIGHKGYDRENPEQAKPLTDEETFIFHKAVANARCDYMEKNVKYTINKKGKKTGDKVGLIFRAEEFRDSVKTVEDVRKSTTHQEKEYQSFVEYLIKKDKTLIITAQMIKNASENQK